MSCWKISAVKFSVWDPGWGRWGVRDPGPLDVNIKSRVHRPIRRATPGDRGFLTGLPIAVSDPVSDALRSSCRVNR